MKSAIKSEIARTWARVCNDWCAFVSFVIKGKSDGLASAGPFLISCLKVGLSAAIDIVVAIVLSRTRKYSVVVWIVERCLFYRRH